MHLSFIAIFTVLAPMVVLAIPPGRPHGPPPKFNKWHQGPPGLEPSATTSVAAGIFPSSAVGAGSTGRPMRAGEKKKGGVPGVAGAGATGAVTAPAASASVSLASYDKK